MRGELTDDQIKLLYVLYLTTGPTSFANRDKERWAKETYLLAVACKGAEEGVFTYDYAPSLALVGGAYMLINISQECLNDLQVLAVKGLVEILSLATKRHLYIRAYRISEEGQKLIEELRKNERIRGLFEEVKRLICCEHGEVMGARLRDIEEEVEGQKVHKKVIEMVCKQGCRFRTNCLFDIEDVSYRSEPVSPWWGGRRDTR